MTTSGSDKEENPRDRFYGDESEFGESFWAYYKQDDIAQFAESEGVEDEIAKIMGSSSRWIRRNLRDVLSEIRETVGDNLDRSDLMADVRAILGRFRDRVNRSMSESLTAANIQGFYTVSEAIEGGDFSPPTDYASAVGTVEPPAEPPPAPPTSPDAGDDGDDEPEIRFPIAEKMGNRLRESPVFASTDYREVAEQAKQGAFAITADLEEKTVQDIQGLLSQNLATSPNAKKFVDDVREVLTESGGLSENHLHTVFRANISSQLSRAKNEALAKPLVGDYFPYRTYYATTDRAVRPEHLAMEKHGLSGTRIYNADDPVWKLFEPPWDYGCRCSWSATSVNQAALRGVQEAKDWIERAKQMADDRGGHFADYLEEARPQQFEFVAMPPFQPPLEFRRR